MDKDQAMYLAIYEAMCTALRGEPVSDFMESFAPVRSVMDLVAEHKGMKETICGERRFSEQLCNSLREENERMKKTLEWMEREMKTHIGSGQFWNLYHDIHLSSRTLLDHVESEMSQNTTEVEDVDN